MKTFSNLRVNSFIKSSTVVFTVVFWVILIVFTKVIRGLEVVGTFLAAFIDGSECSKAIARGASNYYISFYIDLFENSFLTGIILITSLLNCFKTSYDFITFITIL